MSNALLEPLFARLRSSGCSEDVIEGIRRDPTHRAFFQTLGDDYRDCMLSGSSGTDETASDGTDKVKEALKRQQNKPLRNPPSLPRELLLLAWEAQRQTEMQAKKHLRRESMMNTFIVFPKESSSKAFDELEPIYFKEMVVPARHKGFYLLCRSISHAKAMVGVSLLVEDAKGRVEPVGLYSLDCKGIETGPDLEEWLPLGTLFAIREPTFKTNMDGTSSMVRVDSPTDVVFLQPNDPLLTNVKWLTASPARKYRLALKAYSDGLNANPESSNRILLLLNRSQTHLNLDHPNQALHDANTALELLAATTPDPKLVEKAKLRKAKALEERKLLEEALEAYRDAEKEFGGAAQAREGVERVTKKLKQVRTGDYDWKRTVSGSLENFDIADFVGPIQVGKVAGIGGGRGVLTTKAVKAGDLLLVEKAFATGHDDIKAGQTNTTVAIDFRTHKMIKSACIDLVTKIMIKMIDDPSTANSIYSLYGGKDFPPTVEPPFAPVASPLAEPSQVFVDPARIEAIQSRNSFATGQTESSSLESVLSQPETDSSLFAKASLFNHSCLPNAAWTISGNVITFRARTDLAKDTEVLVSYAPVFERYDERKSRLKSICEVNCTCLWCDEDRRAGSTKLGRRQKLDVDFKEIRGSLATGGTISLDESKSISKRLLLLISSLEATYPASSTIRVEVVPAYHLITEVLHPINERSLVDLYFKKSLEAAGVVVEHEHGKETGKLKIVAIGYSTDSFQAVDAFLVHVHRLSRIGTARDLKEAKEWVRAAVEMDRLTSGRREKDFREAWKDSIVRFHVQGLVEEYFASRKATTSARMPTPTSPSHSKSFLSARRRTPLAYSAAPASTSHTTAPPPLYQKILFPANGVPATPPRILHSPSHATLDPLILDLIALSLRAFVTPWYNGGISRDPDKEFLQAVTSVLIHVIQALEVRLVTLDWTELLLKDVPTVLENHYRDWDLAEEKAGGPSAHNLSTDEMFHHLQPHIAISLVGSGPATARVDPIYLRTLVDHLLKILLPPEDYRAETERAIVREVLVGVVFGSVFGKVAQPWFLHGIVARVLEGRETVRAAEKKGSPLSTDSTSSELPSLLDQTLSTLARVPSILGSSLSTVPNLVIAAKSTVLPPHYSSSLPLYSHLLSLTQAILPSSSTLSHLSHILSLPLSFFSRTLDSLLYGKIGNQFATEQTVKLVLEGVIRGMFPNDGWPAPKEPDPDEQGQLELKRRCEEAIAKLLPNKPAAFFYPIDESAPAQDQSQPTLLLAQHLIRPLSSHVANVHLFVLVLDLLVGKLCPELIKSPEE